MFRSNNHDGSVEMVADGIGLTLLPPWSMFPRAFFERFPFDCEKGLPHTVYSMQ